MRRHKSEKARARHKTNERPLSVRYAEVIKLRHSLLQASSAKLGIRLDRHSSK